MEIVRRMNLEKLIDQFPPLCGLLWPADRVVIGRRVCWSLYHLLLSHVSPCVFEKSKTLSAFALRDGHTAGPRFCKAQLVEDFLRLRTLTVLKWKCMDPTGAEEAILLDSAMEGQLGTTLTGLELPNVRPIAYIAMEKLTILLTQCTLLVQLDLRNNCLQEQQLEQLVPALASCQNLKHMELQGNDVGPSGAQRVLEACSGLEFLGLRSCEVHARPSEQAFQGFSAALGQHSSLVGLDLSCNELRCEDMRTLVGGARGMLSRMRRLVLFENEVACDEGGHGVAELLGECCALRELSLCDTEVREQDAGRVAAALGRCTALEHLDLSANAIGAGGAGLVAQALLGGCRASLTHLDVSANPVGARGVAELGAALEECKRVRSLRMVHTKMGVEGGKALGASLTRMRWLRRLEVGFNGLAAEGVGAVAAGVAAGCRALEVLSVRGNQMGDAGVGGLLGAVRGCGRLRELDVRQCGIGDGGLAALAEGLRESAQVTRLDVAENAFGAGGVAALAERMGSLPRLAELDLSPRAVQAPAFARVLRAASDCPALRRIAFRGLVEEGEAAGVLAALRELRPRARVELSTSEFPRSALADLRASGIDVAV